MSSSTKKVLTEIETAEYIGMIRSLLRQSRMEGNRENRTPAPPFIKIGRSVRYLKDDVIVLKLKGVLYAGQAIITRLHQWRLEQAVGRSSLLLGVL
jgi:hypothetical protein